MIANAGKRNSIELVPPHLACGVPEVALPILRRAHIAHERQAAFGEEPRQLAWFDPECQLLAGTLEGSEQILRADEGAGPRQYVAVNVREEEEAAGRRARAPPQGGIDSGFRQVV